MTQIIQLDRADLESIINNIVDAQMQKFFDKKEAEKNADKLVSPREAARQLDVNLTTLWRWHNEGYLVKVYIGNKPRYKQSDINKILKGDK